MFKIDSFLNQNITNSNFRHQACLDLSILYTYSQCDLECGIPNHLFDRITKLINYYQQNKLINFGASPPHFSHSDNKISL